MAGGSLSRSDADKVRSLARLVESLVLDPVALRRTDPDLMAALERACLGCAERQACDRALADGSAARTYAGFCPNARRLNALAGAACGAKSLRRPA